MPLINFTVKADPGVQGYWVAVGPDDVPLINGNGQVNLNEGSHILTWWIAGNSGQGISITGVNISDETVVNIKKSKIPPKRAHTAGIRRFQV